MPRFDVEVVRVNGVLTLPIEAKTAAEAERQAIREAREGTKLQPGGPRLFFHEAGAPIEIWLRARAKRTRQEKE
jgi:hypothetical protein